MQIAKVESLLIADGHFVRTEEEHNLSKARCLLGWASRPAAGRP